MNAKVRVSAPGAAGRELIAPTRQAEMQSTEPNPQLLSLGKKDASRLLEVYVKRSLSLNDGSAVAQKAGIKSRKWVPSAERGVKIRRHSSDSSAHLGSEEVQDEIRALAPASSPSESSFPLMLDETMLDNPVPDDHMEPKPPAVQEKKTKKGTKKTKKPSFLKSFLGLFSKKEVEEKTDREASPERMGPGTPPETPSPTVSCLPVPGSFSGGDKDGSAHPGKPVRRKLSLKKFSFRSSSNETRRPTTLQLSSMVYKSEGILSVEPTSIYYEKVSEELERIVKEVKESPTCENRMFFTPSIAAAKMVAAKDKKTIEEIISLLKKQGDDIDLKMRENGSVSSFFRNLSYTSFQQLADRYMQEEIPSPLPQEAGAPELVRFAFTLDFTAKVAGLSNQTLSRIMGFGNRYLQDRFTQMSRANLGETSASAVQNFNTPD
ncbi:uncharacterized protein LOC108939205 [Arapaima gigas]